MAHIDLLSPEAREDEQKQGPCGREGGVRGDVVTEVRSGSVLRVTWRESVDHPSHFRISFDDDGDDDFADPKTADDRFTNETVLLDGISDAGGGTFSADVTLPDIECDHCTLQLIQVMYDKAPYAPGTNDLYYRCADLTLRRDAPAAPPSEPIDPELEADAGPTAMPPNGSAGGYGGYGGSGNTDSEQDTSAATAAPSRQPAGSKSSDSGSRDAQGSTCSAGPITRALPAVWLLSLCLLFVFSWRRAGPGRALRRQLPKPSSDGGERARRAAQTMEDCSTGC